MYIPKKFQVTEEAQILDFIRENGFAILVSLNEGKTNATHIPIQVSDDGKKLHGHLSKANPQWKNFNQQEVLVIFNGPHTYISSSWYNHENVPTWNYIAVHVYGTIRVIEGDALIDSLKSLTNKYEKNSAKPVSVEKLSPEYFQSALRGVVGFEIEITNMEAAYKLSQNRDKINHAEIINKLEKRNQGDDVKIARAMRDTAAE
jgi:transcriptional regulator